MRWSCKADLTALNDTVATADGIELSLVSLFHAFLISRLNRSRLGVLVDSLASTVLQYKIWRIGENDEVSVVDTYSIVNGSN